MYKLFSGCCINHWKQNSGCVEWRVWWSVRKAFIQEENWGEFLYSFSHTSSRGCTMYFKIQSSNLERYEGQCDMLYNQNFNLDQVVFASEGIKDGLKIDAINSTSSMTKSLSSEFIDGQRKLAALALAGENSESVNPLITQNRNGPVGSFHIKMTFSLHPTKVLSRFVYEHKYKEGFYCCPAKK
ncbi:WD40 repeat-containing protein [Artemisia annua]|uniref:WD40 repeat-containing protein n=1 Tax=Artemisia annua TaxID=35608 RepID=A0A2U1NSS2_ARTAN|nr:WD40 repeat-containing protein [Artemisia annua]